MMAEARDISTTLVRVIHGAGGDVEHPPKECHRCGETKPAREFGKSMFTGSFNTVCRSCVSKAVKTAHAKSTPYRDLAELAGEVGLVLEQSAALDANGDVVEDEDEAFAPGRIWDLSQPETLVRLEVACQRAYRAYLRGSEERGHAAMGRHHPELAAEAKAIAARANDVETERKRTMGDASKSTQDRGSAILSLLKNDGPQDGPTLMKAAGLSKNEWYRVAQFLKDSNAVVQHGIKRASIYALAGQKVERRESAKESPAKRPRQARSSKPARIQTSTNGVSKANGRTPTRHNGVENSRTRAIDGLRDLKAELEGKLREIDSAIRMLEADT